MKKNYNQPQTEIVSIDATNMIMSVSGGNGVNIGGTIDGETGW